MINSEVSERILGLDNGVIFDNFHKFWINAVNDPFLPSYSPLIKLLLG